MNAWTIYWIALVVLCLLALWLLRRHFHWSTRLAAVLVVAVPLLVPVTVSDTEQRAPAWVVFAFESLFGSAAEAQRVAMPLAAAAVLAVIAFGVLLFVRRGRGKTAG